jgi:hypothetical protein
MLIDNYASAVVERLDAAAAAGDDTTRRVAAALATALEPALRLAVIDAASDLAREVTEALGDRVVEIRLDGDELTVAVAPALLSGDGAYDAGGHEGQSRVTLRLPESLKAGAERAAASERVSLNAWLTRAVERALGQRPAGAAGRPDANRLRGWVQA